MQHKIIDFLSCINSKSKEIGGGGRAHFDYTNSACTIMGGKRKKTLLVRKIGNTPVRSGG